MHITGRNGIKFPCGWIIFLFFFLQETAPVVVTKKAVNGKAKPTKMEVDESSSDDSSEEGRACSLQLTGIILSKFSTNMTNGRCFCVMSPIGWVRTQNDPGVIVPWLATASSRTARYKAIFLRTVTFPALQNYQIKKNPTDYQNEYHRCCHKKLLTPFEC